MSSDAGRDFHDHPFNFVSLILKEGYIEHVPGCRCVPMPDGPMRTHRNSPCREYPSGWAVRKKATDFHRVELLKEAAGALTLVLTGRYLRKWGFKTAAGWIPWDEYHRNLYGKEETKALPQPSEIGADTFRVSCPGCGTPFVGAREVPPQSTIDCSCGTRISIEWPEKQ